MLSSHAGPTGKGRRRIDCHTAIAGKRTALLFILGQSNAANTLDVLSRWSVPRVLNFSIYDGLCYLAQDPLIGASDGGGNFATILAGRLLAGGHYEAVILAPIAVHGTRIQQWAPEGEHNRRIIIAIERMREAGLAPTHILWHQGEGNCRDAPESYRSAFHGVLSTIRHHGVDAPIFVAQATVCRCLQSENEAIRAAQRNLVDPTMGIFAGPDTDQLGSDFRYDDCHFNGEGGKRVAELWMSALLQIGNDEAPIPEVHA